MGKEKNLILNLLARYGILIITGILSTQIFYSLFSAITIYPVFFLLKFVFSNISLIGNTLLINGKSIDLIGPCIAASAYYLLLILNLSTRKIKNRLGLFFFSFSSLLIVNILRIFFLAIIFVRGFSFFDLTHKLFWYAGSTIFVVGIWFLGVKLFRIKEIPFYSDIKSVLELKKKPHKSKHSKKH